MSGRNYYRSGRKPARRLWDRAKEDAVTGRSRFDIMSAGLDKGAGEARIIGYFCDDVSRGHESVHGVCAFELRLGEDQAGELALEQID